MAPSGMIWRYPCPEPLALLPGLSSDAHYSFPSTSSIPSFSSSSHHLFPSLRRTAVSRPRLNASPLGLPASCSVSELLELQNVCTSSHWQRNPLPHQGNESMTLIQLEAEEEEEEDDLWIMMRKEARRDAEGEPVLASYLYSTILAHRSLERALAFHLGNKLSSNTLLSTQLFSMILDTFMQDSEIRDAVRADIRAVRERDPACVSYSHCMLNFKGFLACEAHRIAHRLWNQGRMSLALALQSRVSEVFHVDIHPAARIGKGVLFDHATGVVIGETATIGDNVSILHHVTLGGTGAHGCDRHPKIGHGVLIGAGATILGPVKIGEGAKIGACSVVLIDVPPHTTAVGNPARLVGGQKAPKMLHEIPSHTMDHTSFIDNWSDYVI